MTTVTLPARRAVVPSVLSLVPDKLDRLSPTTTRLPDHTAGLTDSNSVTISASSILDLPPGRYHWALFDGLDPSGPSAIESIAQRDARIDELTKEGRESDGRAEILSEQCMWARDLIDAIEGHLECLNADGKLTKKALYRFYSLVSDSMFER